MQIEKKPDDQTGENQQGLIRPETVPVELNLAKWANFIFAPGPDDRSRRIQFKHKNSKTGEVELGAIEVLTSDGKNLRPFDYRVLCGLFSIWWQQRQLPLDGLRPFRHRALARMLGLTWGSGEDHRKEIESSLDRLRFVGIKWNNSFKDKEGGYTTIRNSMTILSRLTTATRKKLVDTKDPKKQRWGETSLGLFSFHEVIDHNLLTGTIKPVVATTVCKLRGEARITLYALLDLFLSKSTHYERRLTELLKHDLQLQGNYKKPSNRKQYVENLINGDRSKPAAERKRKRNPDAIWMLQGVPISTGYITLRVEHAAYNKNAASPKDFKLVVDKIPFLQLPNITERDERLLSAILVYTEKPAFKNLWLKVLRQCSNDHVIFKSISEAKDMEHRGERTGTSKGALLLDRIKRNAEALGISITAAGDSSGSLLLPTEQPTPTPNDQVVRPHSEAKTHEAVSFPSPPAEPLA